MIGSSLVELETVAVCGCDASGDRFSKENLEKLCSGLIGLVNTGVRDFRNSVYATGGVIGVVMESSRLTSDTAEREAL